MAQQSSAPDVGSEQGSLLSFPPGPVGGVNYATAYPPWNGGRPGVHFEVTPGGHMMDDYGRNPGG